MPNPRTNARMAEVLLKAGVIDEMTVKSAVAMADRWGWSLARAVSDLGVVEEDVLVEVLAKSLRTPYLNLGNVLKDNAALRAIGVDFCEKHVVFPVSLKDRTLTLAMCDPTELQVLDQAKGLAGGKVQVVMAPEGQIRSAISKNYRGQDVPVARRKTVSGMKPDPRLQEKLEELGRPAPPAAAANAQPGFSPEEVQRLAAAHDNQEKVGHILRTVQELLAEKLG